MKPNETLLLSREEVYSCTSIQEVIETVEETLKEHAKGAVMFPPRSNLPTQENQGAWPGYNSNLSARPAYLRLQDIAGVRWVGSFSDNTIGIPPQTDLVVLTDPLNGTTLSIMEASFPLVLRVAAQAAIGTKYLAKATINSIAIFGTGLQGKCHLVVFDQIYNVKEAKVYDIKEEALTKFTQEMSNKVKTNIIPCKNAEETAKECDVLINTATSKNPFIHFKNLSQGVFILDQGSYSYFHKDVIQNMDKIVVASLAQSKLVGCLSGFLQNGDIAEKDVYCELQDLVSGKVTGRASEVENIYLTTTGVPTLDIAIAHKVYKKALDKGIGKVIRLGIDLETSSFL